MDGRPKSAPERDAIGSCGAAPVARGAGEQDAAGAIIRVGEPESEAGEDAVQISTVIYQSPACFTDLSSAGMFY